MSEAEAKLEEPALRVRVDELEGARVGSACVLETIEPAEQLGAGGVQVDVAVQVEPVDERERVGDLACLRERDGVVQLHDRGAGDACQLAVERSELRPVLRLLD